MDEVRGDEFGDKGREDIGEEDDAFGDCRADEVEGCRENDYVQDIVYEA